MATDSNPPESATRTAAQFATTHWSAVLAAGDGDSSVSSAALERLCRTYWYPLYAFVRRKGHVPDDAQDLTQTFFERLIEKRFLKDVAPERGLFRSFLLAALTHFLANEWDRVKAAKRGGGFQLISLDSSTLEERYGADASSEESPERHFDRLWANAVMDHALELLEQEYRAADKAAQFEGLADFLSRPPNPGEYAAVGEQLGLNNHAVAVAVGRLRERYRALVRAEIADTVDSPAEVDAELRYLIELVSC
jgi:DNA-directed RNA polymerase specialized sigma24 family protein